MFVDYDLFMLLTGESWKFIKIHVSQGFNVECSARSHEARQNVMKFLNWCRELRVPESSIFLPDDLLKLKVFE